MHILKPFFLILVFGMGFLTISFQSPKNELIVEYIWEDDFSEPEIKKIELWLNGVSEAIVQTFSPYPFTTKLYIHRTSGNEPVPWAETSRDGEQAVHFHVNPRFSLLDFQMDWTAAHELSHLSIPFVGRSNMWFSEGYASYWQWQVLLQQGIYSTNEIQMKYNDKLNKIKPYYDSDESFLETSRKLKANHNYRAVYWGGACYFFQVDLLLKQKYNTTLREVISKYQNKGRLTDESLEELISSLDDISKSKVFSKMLYTFQNGSAREAVMPTALFYSD